jgi:hypothetical protein
MYNLKDRCYLYFKINNQNIPLEAITLKSITLHSNVLFSYPTADIIFSDSVNYFSSRPLTDGDKIDIVAGSNSSIPNKPIYRFRISKVTKQEESHIDVYHISCIFNAPKYINENFKGSYSTTSSDAIRLIAQASGLDFATDPSTDNQVWYGFGKKRYLFAQDIAKHSYLNNSSCYGLGLTLAGELRLKNISNINFNNSNKLFVQGNKVNENAVSVLGQKENTESGFYNNLFGYKFELIQQGTDSNITHNSLTLPVKSTTVNINSDLVNGLTGSVLNYSPVSCENTHSNYYVAEYQNTRIKSTFANSLLLTLNEESRVDLYDSLKYALMTNVAGVVNLNTKLSGGYIVTGKAVHIESGYYYEKLLITRQGYNLNVITSQDKKVLGLL